MLLLSFKPSRERGCGHQIAHRVPLAAASTATSPIRTKWLSF